MSVNIEVEKYLIRFSALKGDEYHCANCQRIGMCLALRFAQPEVCPDEVLGKCRFFFRRKVERNTGG